MEDIWYKNERCCLCGKKIVGYVHNPYPLSKIGWCCSECDSDKVIPARMEL